MANSIPNSVGIDPFLFRGSDTPRLGQQLALNHLDEKRQSPRLPFRGRAKAVVFPSPTSPVATTTYDSEVMTSDLSSGGVSILCRKQLNIGQQLMLILSEKMRLAEVCWCRPVWDGLFVAGCKFISEQRDADVDQQLLAIDVVISNEASWWTTNESA